MQVSFSFSYIAANLFCMALLTLLSFCTRNVEHEEADAKWFVAAMHAMTLFFGLDSLWALLQATAYPRSQLAVAAINVPMGIVLNIACSSFYIYVMMREHWGVCDTLRKRWASGAFGLVCSVAMLVMALVDLDLVSTPDGSLTTLFKVLFLVAPSTYCLLVVVFSAIGLWRHRSLPDLQLYIMMTIFPLLMFIAGYVQTMVVAAPLYAYFATLGFSYMFISFTMERIMTDPLTELMQRGWMLRLFKSTRLTGEGSRGGYLFMIDLNGLKTINDAHGHLEGDKAIRTVGLAIGDAVSSFEAPGYACRYGGDEFMIIAYVGDDEGADRLVARIRNRISTHAVELDLKVEPQIAVGYHSLGTRGFSEEVLVLTDKIMYADKRRAEAEGRGRGPRHGPLPLP